MVPGGSWWSFVLCCLAESQCIQTLCLQDALEIDETSGIHEKVKKLAVPSGSWWFLLAFCVWFLVVPGGSSYFAVEWNQNVYKHFASKMHLISMKL